MQIFQIRMPNLAAQETVEEKGFYILPSQLFENVLKKAKRDENLK